MSGAPVGESITANINGNDITFHIKPNVFSDATLNALNRMQKEASRKRKVEALKELGQLKAHLDEETFASIQSEVVKGFVAPEFNGYLDGVEILKSREGMACALMMNCDQISNMTQAYQVLEGSENIVDVFNALFSAGVEAVDAAKNSDLPPQKEDVSLKADGKE